MSPVPRIDLNYQYIAQGIVIVVAIALDIRKYIARSKMSFTSITSTPRDLVTAN